MDSLRAGGVNGRYPPRVSAGAEELMLRWEGIFAGPDCRVLLLGGVNGRYPPRFPFCGVATWLPAFRAPGFLAPGFISRAGGMPALGFCEAPNAAVPRAP